MFAAGFKSLGQLTPRTDRMMSATAPLALSLAAPHRVVDRVHRHTANVRAPTQPAAATGLAARNVHMFDVTDLANCRVRILVNPANLTRRHPDKRITCLAVA